MANWIEIGSAQAGSAKWKFFRAWDPDEGYTYQASSDGQTMQVYKSVRGKETSWYSREKHQALPSALSNYLTPKDRLTGFKELTDYIFCLINREKQLGLVREEEEHNIFVMYMDTDFRLLRERMLFTVRQEKRRKKKRGEEKFALTSC
ncbi:MAG: hypothetical protein HY514_04655 [Candidatus Aenigmarchaeota archaeon]|nr:hypothetical protein [Candidatus Aenigmarchaeota archaeon]